MRSAVPTAVALRNGAARTFASGGSSGSTPRRPPKVLIPALPPFLDKRFPGPEPRVSAFLMGSAIDLQRLRRRLVEIGCPTVMWQGQVLLCGSSPAFAQQACSAVFLADGCAVCWHMSRDTERLVQKITASTPSERKRPAVLRTPREGDSRASAERMHQLGLGVPLAAEHLDIVEAPDGVITTLDPDNGSVRLTRDLWARASNQLGISLGLAAAVRLSALERRIEVRLESEWRDMEVEDVHRRLNLGRVSHGIFTAERGLHELRYELNSEAGLLDAPDLLLEHALEERLYDQVVAHFDVRRRTALLNDRLSYSLDYLHTLGEHVRHLHSARLETMIIVIIFIELCVGIAHMYASTVQHSREPVLSEAASRSERIDSSSASKIESDLQRGPLRSLLAERAASR